MVSNGANLGILPETECVIHTTRNNIQIVKWLILRLLKYIHRYKSDINGGIRSIYVYVEGQ